MTYLRSTGEDTHASPSVEAVENDYSTLTITFPRILDFQGVSIFDNLDRLNMRVNEIRKSRLGWRIGCLLS